MTTTATSSEATSYGAPRQRRPLTSIVAEMIEAIESADGEVTAAVDALDLELEDKVEAYRAVMLQLEHEAGAFQELIDSYRLRVAARENQITGLKFRLDQALKAMGVEKLKTPTATVYYQRNKHVEVENEAAFLESAEDRFVVVKQSVNKQEIKKALEAGETVEGAAMVESKHLRFR